MQFHSIQIPFSSPSQKVSTKRQRIDRIFYLLFVRTRIAMYSVKQRSSPRSLVSISLYCIWGNEKSCAWNAGTRKEQSYIGIGIRYQNILKIWCVPIEKCCLAVGSKRHRRTPQFLFFGEVRGAALLAPNLGGIGGRWNEACAARGVRRLCL